MFLENMFGNLFGLIWLIIFILGIAALIIWLFIKQNKVEEGEKTETSNDIEVVEEEKKVETVEEKTISEGYEIVEVDGFFKVRKKGSERTIRKFPTELEAINYVKEKE